MKQILNREGISFLYHFTSIDNLSLIAECKGLCSKEKLEKLGLLDGVATGGNELSLSLDKHWSNWKKVHLYFSTGSPMAYGKQQESHICYLFIDADVALWQGVVFTDVNATDSGQHRGEGLAGLGLIDFSAVKANWPFGSRERFKKKQAEALIPNEIPLDYIKAVAFISDASLKEGERLWGDITRPPFTVNRTLFHDGFPYVDTAVLTSAEITKDNVKVTNFDHSQHFSRPANPVITLLVTAAMTAGLQVRVIWKASTGVVIFERETEFEKEGYLWHWEHIQTEALQVGHYVAEYYLGDIRWFSMPFSVADL
jgi:hypothetical protein